MSSGFFRGTNTEQDSRFGDSDKKLMKKMKFSKILDQKVNMKKVNADVMKRWITQRITSLLGFEDDIVVGTCVNYLAEEERSRERMWTPIHSVVLYSDFLQLQGKVDPKKLQLQLTGFLEKSTSAFMEELWGLLVDAQNSLGGIPSAFLQEKKQEIMQAKEEERKQEEELLQRMEAHRQEMEHAALAVDTSMSVTDSVAESPRPAGGRASRWGVSQQATDPEAQQVEETGTSIAMDNKESMERGEEPSTHVGVDPFTNAKEQAVGEISDTASGANGNDEHHMARKRSKRSPSAEKSRKHRSKRMENEKKNKEGRSPDSRRDSRHRHNRRDRSQDRGDRDYHSRSRDRDWDRRDRDRDRQGRGRDQEKTRSRRSVSNRERYEERRMEKGRDDREVGTHPRSDEGEREHSGRKDRRSGERTRGGDRNRGGREGRDGESHRDRGRRYEVTRKQEKHKDREGERGSRASKRSIDADEGKIHKSNNCKESSLPGSQSEWVEDEDTEKRDSHSDNQESRHTHPDGAERGEASSEEDGGDSEEVDDSGGSENEEGKKEDVDEGESEMQAKLDWEEDLRQKALASMAKKRKV